MKVIPSYLFVAILVLSATSCSSHKEFITRSDSECLNIGYIFFDKNNLENVKTILYSRPNKVTISYHTDGNSRKFICSNQPFKIINGKIVESTLNQNIYFFQDSSDGLQNIVKHKGGFWYSESAPKEKWLSVFEHKET